MRKIILAIGIVCFCSVNFTTQAKTDYTDDQNDEVMQRVYGTCTKQSCPPGTKVFVDAKEGDSGSAVTADGRDYDLLQLRGRPFVILDDPTSSQPDAKVRDSNGSIYYIQRMFLKKN